MLLPHDEDKVRTLTLKTSSECVSSQSGDSFWWSMETAPHRYGPCEIQNVSPISLSAKLECSCMTLRLAETHGVPGSNRSTARNLTGLRGETRGGMGIRIVGRPSSWRHWG